MEIPQYIKEILTNLEKAGYEAFIVGGCVRDLLMEKKPKDWDITTNARPEEILKVFPNGKYENIFGTVLIPVKNEGGEVLDVVETTTYRSEQGYSDRRHPDEITFETRLDKDLERRDFTINAMAMSIDNCQLTIVNSKKYCEKINDYFLIDLFGGRKDMKDKVIRAVGEPADRFKEDALRMMRTVRFFSELGFEIEPKTERAITKLAGSIKFVSKERIRDELVRMLSSDRPYEAVIKLHELKLLQYIIPELEKGIGVAQDRHHIHTVFKHSVLALKFCPSKDWRVRLAALLHDIAKPDTKRMDKGHATFYNHDILGAKYAKKIAQRLKLSVADSEKVATLVRNHMFYYNVDEVTAASVRRLIKKVGEENLKDLIDLRIADRLGSGVPKAKPYKLRHLEYMMKKVRKDPLSVKMLKISGNDIMKILNTRPGPKIGAMLDVLLAEVIEDPELNVKVKLEKRARELDSFGLDELREKAREKIDEKKEEEDNELKKEFWVK
ncbi:MAG: CCA tRNA nucleotidyltransferase [Patescibacteria group bacterium]|jgi:putative nucleotidyltransferase with HDIG domain